MPQLKFYLHSFYSVQIENFKGIFDVVIKYLIHRI